MVLVFRTVTLVLLLTAVGGQAFAQTKARAPGKTSAPGKTPAPSKAPASGIKLAPVKAPKPKSAQEVFVCVRPSELGPHEYRWGYDIGGRLTTEWEDVVGPSMFVWDPQAPRHSVNALPKPHANLLRCPGDTRPVPPPEGGPAVLAPKPLGISQSLSTGSSRSGKLPERVERFCTMFENFRSSESANGKQAKKFAARLRKAVMENASIGPITTDELSLEAATILAKHFGETITAAMAHRQVVAPENVQHKFREVMREPQWKILPLLDKRWTGTSDTVPAILLTYKMYDLVTGSLAETLTNVTTPAEAKEAYQKAYTGLSPWLTAITPYFEEKKEAEEEEEEERP